MSILWEIVPLDTLRNVNFAVCRFIICKILLNKAVSLITFVRCSFFLHPSVSHAVTLLDIFPKENFVLISKILLNKAVSLITFARCSLFLHPFVSQAVTWLDIFPKKNILLPQAVL